MDQKVAALILDAFAQQLRTLSYNDLCALRKNPQCKEVSGPDDKPYQVEWEAHWDDPRQDTGTLLVIVSIDDGAFRTSLRPMTASFLMAPDGTFVGE